MEVRNKRKLFWLFMLSVPFVFLVGLECVLRWVKFGDNLDLVFIQQFHGKQYYTVNRFVSRRYFPRRSIQTPGVYDGTFEVKKSPTTYRIFFLGESTMQGFPYEYNGALHRLLEDRLMQLFPDRRIEIINLGITAVNSYAVLDLMREVVNYEPDLIVVYLGHNEFYGSFGVGSVEFMGRNRSFINFYLRLEHFKIVQALQKLIDVTYSAFGKDGTSIPTAGFMETLAREKSIAYRSTLYTVAKENFQANLNDIADIAVSHHVPLMLSTVVSNLRDQPPFISGYNDSTVPEMRTLCSEFIRRGKLEQQSEQYEQALKEYVQASLIDSMFADIHYNMGICFEALQNIPEARRHFALARDCDLLRFRATDEFNEIIKEVTDTKNLMLADIAGAFRDSSANGIVGKSLMLEHVHPNLDGYFLIAKEYARVMRQNNCIAEGGSWKTPLTDEEYKSMSLMTLFDFEVSFLRIDNLLHHWPFFESDSTRYRPTTSEGKLAEDYLRGKIDWEHAHYRLADQYRVQQRPEDAAREYLAIAKVLGFDFNPLVMAGDVQLTMKNYHEAESLYRMALQRDDNQFVDVRLGELFSEKELSDSAIYYYRRALEKDSYSEMKFKQEWKLQLMEHLAEEYMKKGDVQHARDQLLGVLAIDHTSVKARRLLETLPATGSELHSQ